MHSGVLSQHLKDPTQVSTTQPHEVHIFLPEHVLNQEFLNFPCVMGPFCQLVNPFQSHIFNAQIKTHRITLKTNCGEMQLSK